MITPSQRESQYTPLGLAVYRDNAEIVNLLLSAGADPTKRFKYPGKDYTPLEYAKAENKNKALAALKQFSKRPAAVPKTVPPPTANDSAEVARLTARVAELEKEASITAGRLLASNQELGRLRNAEQQLKDKDRQLADCYAEIRTLKQSLADARVDAMHKALDEEHRQDLNNHKNQWEIRVSSTQRIADQATEKLEQKMRDHAVLEEHSAKRIAALQQELERARQGSAATHLDAAVQDQLNRCHAVNAELSAKVKHLQQELSAEVRRNARKVGDVKEGELQVDKTSKPLGTGATAIAYRGTFKGRDGAVKVFKEQSTEIVHSLE